MLSFLRCDANVPTPASFMSLLHRAHFLTTIASFAQLEACTPLAAGLPEVAFVGRSNAGKSTAINRLCNQKQLAFASKTPGRTQHLNYFEVADRDRVWGYLVDLPGYGYAAASGQEDRSHWDAFLGGYLASRQALRGVILIMDARRPLTPLDRQMIDWMKVAGKPIHALLSKADKLNRSELGLALAEVRRAFAETPNTVQAFSALNRTGFDEAEQKVLDWLDVPRKEKPQ